MKQNISYILWGLFILITYWSVSVSPSGTNFKAPPCDSTRIYRAFIAYCNFVNTSNVNSYLADWTDIHNSYDNRVAAFTFYCDNFNVCDLDPNISGVQYLPSGCDPLTTCNYQLFPYALGNESFYQVVAFDAQEYKKLQGLMPITNMQMNERGFLLYSLKTGLNITAGYFGAWGWYNMTALDKHGDKHVIDLLHFKNPPGKAIGPDAYGNIFINLVIDSDLFGLGAVRGGASYGFPNSDLPLQTACETMTFPSDLGQLPANSTFNYCDNARWSPWDE